MKNDVKKLNQAIYFDQIMQNEIDQLAIDGAEISEEEYEAKCLALIDQKLYVEKKAIDVIEFIKQLEQREEFLKQKKKEQNEKQNIAKSWINRATNSLKNWILATCSDKKLTIDEYELSLRESEGLVIDETKTDKIPDEFKAYSVTMPKDVYLKIESFLSLKSKLTKVGFVDEPLLKEWLKVKNEKGERINTCEGAYLEERQNLQIK